MAPYIGKVSTDLGLIEYSIGRWELDEFIAECNADPDVYDFVIFDGDRLIYDSRI